MPKKNLLPTVKHVSPKDVFMHLLSIIMLYAAAISFLVIIFQVVNIKFPDILDANYNNYYLLQDYYALIRSALAFLIITYPVYVLSFYLLKKSYAVEPEKKEMRLRKWLVYFTLFITALIIVGNLIALLMGLLQGELTVRFILKISAVFFVAGSTFAYYLMDLKDNHALTLKIFAGFVSAVVLGTVILGFFFIGSPATERLRRLDEQKIQHLQMLQNALQNYYATNKVLPSSLNAMPNTYSDLVFIDPQNKLPYTYSVTDALHFKLCANFNLESIGLTATSGISRPVSVAYNSVNWEHPAGDYCFNLEIYSLEDAKVF